eukprot:356742-Chlamydomonas_euryale.AAC.8
MYHAPNERGSTVHATAVPERRKSCGAQLAANMHGFEPAGAHAADAVHGVAQVMHGMAWHRWRMAWCGTQVMHDMAWHRWRRAWRATGGAWRGVEHK